MNLGENICKIMPLKIKNNPIIYLFGKTWQYSAGNRKNVLLYFLLFAIANAVNFVSPLIIAKVFNIVQRSGISSENFPEILFWLVVFSLSNFAFWCFHGPARIIENRNAFLASANYKKYLLDGILAFPLEWHMEHHSGDTIDKIGKGTNAMFQFSHNTFQFFAVLFKFISSYLILAYFNIHAAYIVLLVVYAAIFVIVRFDRVIVPQYDEIYHLENKASEKIFDAISNITTVIILRIERLISSSIYRQIMAPFGIFQKNSRVNEIKWFLSAMFGNFMIVLVLGTYLYSEIRSGEAILIGTVYLLYEYVRRIEDNFYNIAYMYSDVVRQRSAVANSEEIVNDFTEFRKFQQIKSVSDWNEIRIEGLNFSYRTKEGTNLHLDGVSLLIKKGERMALIGESGSGKTTLLKIIRELYHPNAGDFYVDGKNLKHGFASISSGIALIPQDPEIFSTTIRENITVGVPYGDDYIRKFTDMACFTEVAEKLPHKLESYIFEKGVNLSGGEKQRLALARGLMACEDKSIILLDEPTSSVDTKNELKIYQNIFREFKEKTIIASVHRLHLLPMFDKIYFFKSGRIIASGSLGDLLSSSKEFRSLWKKYHKPAVHR